MHHVQNVKVAGAQATGHIASSQEIEQRVHASAQLTSSLSSPKSSAQEWSRPQLR